jgi:hypothetical protein
LLQKILLRRRANHLYEFALSLPEKRGVSRSSRTLVKDAMDALVSRGERC